MSLSNAFFCAAQDERAIHIMDVLCVPIWVKTYLQSRSKVTERHVDKEYVENVSSFS